MKPPMLVAEMSSSHLGNLQRAIAIIDAAAKAGADSVKAQCWTQPMCLDETYRIEGGAWHGRLLADLYREAYTPVEWLPALHARITAHGMTPIASVFDAGAIEACHDWPILKIASFEITDIPLIEAVAKTKQPMIISTGMATYEEIDAAVSAAKQFRRGKITLLKCVSAYPSDAADANLRTMQRLSQPGCKIGLSDHSNGIGVAVAATVLGATLIEKHLTISRADGGLDAAFSMEPHEFAMLVTECRRATAAIGTVRYGPTDAELPQLKLRRSLVWARDLPAQHRITRDDITTARPATGMCINRINELVGMNTVRHTIRTVSFGQPINVTDFQ